MAEPDTIQIQELTTGQIDASTILPIVVVDDSTNPATYTTAKTNITAIANLLLSVLDFNTLTTTAKTIIAAINEAAQSGGGGGSSVSWSQLIGTGTKIAQITINGSTTDVYAPTSGGASYTDITGTLVAGNTTITFSDAAILTTSTVDIYTDVYGVNPTSVVVATGSVTITFPAQANNMGVKVRVS